VNDVLVEFEAVSKAYGGLRPLRLRRLAIEPGAVVALAGFDAVTAEVFVNLATGATLPDAGTVSVMGRATASITDSDEWLSTVDRFGIISERVVLLEQFSPLQNIAMAMTLEVEPVAPEVREQAAALAREAGLETASLDQPLGSSTAARRHRVRLARAMSASPAVLLVEHPLAGLAPGEAEGLSTDLRRVAGARGIAMVVLAADAAAAEPFADRVLRLDGATGELIATHARGLLGKLTGWMKAGR